MTATRRLVGAAAVGFAAAVLSLPASPAVAADASGTETRPAPV